MSPRKRMTSRLGVKLDPLTRALLVALQFHEGAPSAAHVLRMLVRRAAVAHAPQLRGVVGFAPCSLTCQLCNALAAAFARGELAAEQIAIPGSGRAPKLLPREPPGEPECSGARDLSEAKPEPDPSPAKPRRKRRKVRDAVDAPPVPREGPGQQGA